MATIYILPKILLLTYLLFEMPFGEGIPNKKIRDEHQPENNGTAWAWGKNQTRACKDKSDCPDGAVCLGKRCHQCECINAEQCYLMANNKVGCDCSSSGNTGHHCECRLDECREGTDNCDVNAVCTDTDIGFTCTCNEGYTGDGVNCTEVRGCNSYITNATKRDCAEGERDDGMNCWLDSYDRISSGLADGDPCPDGPDGYCYRCFASEDLYGTYCFPKCNIGYHAAVECCRCEPDGGANITQTLFQRSECSEGTTAFLTFCINISECTATEVEAIVKEQVEWKLEYQEELEELYQLVSEQPKLLLTVSL